MARKSTVTVYEVLFMDQRHAGPAGDGSHTRRFLDKKQAETCGSGPARAIPTEAPRHVAQRWRLV